MNININENKNIINLHSFNNFHLESYTDSYISDGFCIFTSINDILYLIYSNHNSIIAYDLNNTQKICEVKNAHEDEDYISSFKHILDKNQKKDLLLSISYDSNYLKLWDIKDFELLCYIKDIYSNGFLFCAHFLLEQNKNQNDLYILTSNCNFSSSSGPIKKFNLKGEQIDIINKSEGLDVFYLTDFYDSITKKQYLIGAIKGSIISFDLENNQIYKSYSEDNSNFHFYIIINKENKEGIIQIIESSADGKIRIWDFHGGKLLYKININNNWLFGMCLWDNQYIFVGDGDSGIKLVDLLTGKIMNQLSDINGRIITIKKIKLKKFGECLISQRYLKGGIKLWIKN